MSPDSHASDCFLKKKSKKNTVPSTVPWWLPVEMWCFVFVSFLWFSSFACAFREIEHIWIVVRFKFWVRTSFFHPKYMGCCISFNLFHLSGHLFRRKEKKALGQLNKCRYILIWVWECDSLVQIFLLIKLAFTHARRKKYGFTVYCLPFFSTPTERFY